MKRFFYLAALILYAGKAWSTEDLDDNSFLGEMFFLDPQLVPVEFAITNDFAQAKLYDYRARPQQFAPDTVSNLLKEVNFQPSDQRNPMTTNGNGEAFFFRTIPWDTSLKIIPRQGLIELGGLGPKFSTNIGANLPSQTESQARASNLLFGVLGVRPGEIIRRKNGGDYFTYSQTKTSWFDKQKKETVHQTSEWRINALRAIDGWDTVAGIKSSPDAFRLTIVDGGEITRLDFQWPPIEKVRPLPAPSLQYLKETVARGKARTLWHEVPVAIHIHRVEYCYERIGHPPHLASYQPLVKMVGTSYGRSSLDAETNRLIAIFCELPRSD